MQTILPAVRQGLTPLSVAMRRAFGRAVTPIGLFRNTEQGLWYDPSDFEAYMAPKGPEVIVNPGGPFVSLDRWGTQSATATLALTDGAIVATRANAASSWMIQEANVNLIAGRHYEIIAEVASPDGRSTSIQMYDYVVGAPFGSAIGAVTAANRTRITGVIRPNSTGRHGFNIAQPSGDPIGSRCVLHSFSIRELTGLANCTLFQDAAGTTPVTAVEQPVGLVLDKSRGGVPIGSNLSSNGGAPDTANGWTAGTGWTTSGGVGIASGPTGDGLRDSPTPYITGRTYRVEFDKVDGGVVSVYLRAGTVATASGAGRIRMTIVAGSSSTRGVEFYFAAAGTISNISVRELPGNHATQSTAASRPVLSARVNLVPNNTEEVFVAGLIRATQQANVAAAPDGRLVADKLVEDTTPTATHIEQTSLTFIGGATYTYSRYLKAGERRYARLFLASSAGANAIRAEFDLQTGIVLSSGLAGTGWTLLGASITPVGNGWFRCSVSGINSTNTSGYFYTGILGPNAEVQYTGDGSSGIFMWGAQLEYSPTATRYQRVTTATDYDWQGFPLDLRFDGVDDFLQTGSINFTATDKMTVFAGVHKASDAATGMVVESGTDSAAVAGTVAIFAPAGGGSIRYQFASRGATNTAYAATSGVQFNAPHTAIIAASGDLASPAATLRIGGAVAATVATATGGGNYASQPLYIGRRGGTSLPFNGRIFGLVIRGAASSADQIASTERFLARKTGVTLP